MNIFNFIKDNFVAIAATTALAVITGGSSLAVQAIGIGAAVVIGSSIDADRKKRENESKQLDLQKGVSDETKKEVENLQGERSQEANKLNAIDQQVAQKQNRLNSSNLTEPERTQLKSEIAALISSKSTPERNIKELDSKISSLIKSNPLVKPNNLGIINLPKAEELDFQTKLIIGGIVFLIIYFMVIKDSDRR